MSARHYRKTLFVVIAIVLFVGGTPFYIAATVYIVATVFFSTLLVGFVYLTLLQDE